VPANTKGKRIVAPLGDAVFLMAGLSTLILWDEIEIRRRVRALENDPALFEESPTAEKGSIEEIAFRRFLRTRSGQ